MADEKEKPILEKKKRVRRKTTKKTSDMGAFCGGLFAGIILGVIVPLFVFFGLSGSSSVGPNVVESERNLALLQELKDSENTREADRTRYENDVLSLRLENDYLKDESVVLKDTLNALKVSSAKVNSRNLDELRDLFESQKEKLEATISSQEEQIRVLEENTKELESLRRNAFGSMDERHAREVAILNGEISRLRKEAMREKSRRLKSECGIPFLSGKQCGLPVDEWLQIDEVDIYEKTVEVFLSGGTTLIYLTMDARCFEGKRRIRLSEDNAYLCVGPNRYVVSTKELNFFD